MRFLILTLYIFFYFTSFSQNNFDNFPIYCNNELQFISNKNYNNIYLDLDLNKIDSTLYSNKCKNKMRKCIQYINDSTLIHAIYPTFKFGKLSEYSNKRIRKEIYRNKDYNGNIIIHYAYNLKSIDYILKLVKSRNKQLETEKTIISKGKNVSKKTNKCIKKLENKFYVDVLHYYFKGDDKYTKDLHWIKDTNKIIKNYFFKFSYKFYYVIIKPDGEYFQIGALITPKNIKKLLKNSDWSSYKKDLIESEKNREPKGFFNMPHIHNCL